MFNQDKFYGYYRQASGYVPKNIKLDDEYLSIEMKYRNVRTQTNALLKHLEDFKTYEHGGPTYKAILEGFEKVKGKTKLGENDDLSDNMFNVGEQIFNELSKNHYTKDNRAEAEKLKKAYRVMHNKKHDLNEKITEIKKNIKMLIKEAGEIDDDRTKLKNIQFKAERAYEAAKASDPNVDLKNNAEAKKLVDGFHALEGKCKASMKDFLNNEKHEGILHNLSKALTVHLEETLSELKHKTH